MGIGNKLNVKFLLKNENKTITNSKAYVGFDKTKGIHTYPNTIESIQRFCMKGK